MPENRNPPAPLDLTKLKVFPLQQRFSQSSVEEIAIKPDSAPPECSVENLRQIQDCAKKIHAAKQRNVSVMFIYGAHLVKNGGSEILNELIGQRWITHLATNGAGTIHDWEFAFLG